MSAENSRTSSAIADGRDNFGRFTSAGNPGRIPGTKNRISNEALRAVRDMKDTAIQQLREKLVAGDWQATLFILERVLPRGRMIELDGTSPQAISEALQTGILTTEEAKNLATVLEKLASIDQLTELNRRIERLEQVADGQR